MGKTRLGTNKMIETNNKDNNGVAARIKPREVKGLGDSMGMDLMERSR